MSNLMYCEKCQSGYLHEQGHVCPNEPLSASTDLLGNDEPPAMGAGCGNPPMPTPKEEWMAKYVQRMVESGIDAEDAWACCRAGEDDHDYTDDPRDAADDEMSYWADDGDA